MIEPVACDPVVSPVDRDQAGRLPAHSHPLKCLSQAKKEQQVLPQRSSGGAHVDHAP